MNLAVRERGCCLVALVAALVRRVSATWKANCCGWLTAAGGAELGDVDVSTRFGARKRVGPDGAPIARITLLLFSWDSLRKR